MERVKPLVDQVIGEGGGVKQLTEVRRNRSPEDDRYRKVRNEDRRQEPPGKQDVVEISRASKSHVVFCKDDVMFESMSLVEETKKTC